MVLVTERHENFPIDKIIVKNRFRRDKGSLEPLMDSIREKGLIHPIVLNEAYELVVGERRLLAHKALEMTDIRADIIKDKDKISLAELERDENIARADFHWSEAATIEKAIFDMKRKKDPSWTIRKHADMRESSKSSVQRKLALADAFELLPDLQECPTQDDAYKEYKKLEEEAAISYARQQATEETLKAPQWAKDHYNLGDCLAGMREMQDGSFDFAEVDPPYAIDLDQRKKRNADDEGHIDDYKEITKENFPAIFKEAAASVYRLLKPNTFAVFWYGLQWHQFTYDTLRACGFAVNEIPAIWYKGQAGQTAQPDIMLASSYEPFFLARKGQPRMARQGRSNVFHYAPLAPSKKIHITEKPITLMEDMLGTLLFPGCKILVPYLGSGVTLRAAYRTGHTGLGWDISERHRERFLKAVATEFADDTEASG